MKKRPILTKEAEVALIKKAQHGSNKAKTALLWYHTGYVYNTVRYYKSVNCVGIDFDDMLQEGSIGFLDAIKHFNPKFNCRLTTFANKYIRKYVTAFLTDKGRTVHIPQHAFDKLRNIDKIAHSDTEIIDIFNKTATRMGKKRHQAEASLGAYSNYRYIDSRSVLVYKESLKPFELLDAEFIMKFINQSKIPKEVLEVMYRLHGMPGYKETPMYKLSKEYMLSKNALEGRIRRAYKSLRKFLAKNGIKHVWDLL